MLSDAGYATRIVPPLPLQRIERTPVTGRDWSYLQARLVTATAEAYGATTAADISDAVMPVMDPEGGVLERITALLDTAAQRLSALADHDPSARTLAQALQDASSTLTQAGYRIAEADTPAVNTAESAYSARADAAHARTASAASPSPTAAASAAGVLRPRTGALTR
ncbi:hypothetical protein [Kitasatospora sp. NPDC057015]|uniref:hypothetical protein n=1 Tax=Kitasatospora sp. NPDC057015 TaxID=3346001 RepID=UPI00363F12A9